MTGGEGQASFVVSVDDEHLDDLPAVIERLRAAGLEVERQMATSGVVTGTAPPSRAQALRAIEGVAEVEQSREYRLPPPDADVQ
jgi:methylmalonyl-CoA mutase cobalamin-binding subunit